MGNLSCVASSSLTTSDLVRNLSPQAADRILDASSSTPANLPPEEPTVELPPVMVYPTLAPPSEDTPSATIDATDMAKLTASIGTKATVQGTTTGTVLTVGHTALIIPFGEASKSFVIFVKPAVYSALNARYGGLAATALSHKLVRVTGTIVVYHTRCPKSFS